MKTETLEALLIDREFDELSPDVRELLAAYLADHPEHAGSADAVQSVTGLARRASLSRRPHEAPAIPPPPWRMRTARRSILRAEWMRLAACLAVGLAVGWIVRREQRMPTVATAISPAVASPAEDEPGRPDPARAFWSLSGVTRSAASRPVSQKLHWDSPAKMPHLKEKP